LHPGWGGGRGAQKSVTYYLNGPSQRFQKLLKDIEIRTSIFIANTASKELSEIKESNNLKICISMKKYFKRKYFFHAFNDYTNQ